MILMDLNYRKVNHMKEYVRAIQIAEGLKIYMPDEASTTKLDRQLKGLGIQIRPGRNVEADIWSIYVISVPEYLIGTSYEL